MACCLKSSSTLGPKSVEEFDEKLAEIPDGDSSVYWLLSQAVPKVQKNRQCVLAAVRKNGLALDVAANELKTDKEIVLAAVTQDGDAFSYVNKFDKMWKEKDFVLEMVRMQGSALQYAHAALTADEEVVMAAISAKGSALQYADAKFKSNKKVALEAVSKEGEAFSYVTKTGVIWKEKDFVLPMVKMQGIAMQYVDKSAEMWRDKEFVLRIVEMQGNALEFADGQLKADKEVVVAAVNERGDALRFVDKTATFWKEKPVVLSLVQSTGRALEFASDDLKADREVVHVAARTTPTSLKFAKKGLDRDRDMKKASGQLDGEQQSYEQREQAVMSVGFTSTDYATNFALMLKRNLYLRNFRTYNPNGRREHCCSPGLTNISHPCRGTQATCGFTEPQGSAQTPGEKKPTNQTCWRVAFRKHLESEIRATRGFMIQVQDKNGLDDGQKIETEMAQQADVKIFRTMTTSEDVTEDQMVKLEEAIKDWYTKKCKSHYMVEIPLR